MTSVRELFTLSNEALLELWQRTKLEDVQMRFDERLARVSSDAGHDAIAKVREERKIAIETIRLVISFRLMGRENGPALAENEE